jgi:hypothetical protein
MIFKPEEMYGFRWGNFAVQRAFHDKGRLRCVTIETDAGRSIDVYISEGGRSIRVYDPKKRRLLK